MSNLLSRDNKYLSRDNKCYLEIAICYLEVKNLLSGDNKTNF